MKITDTHAHTKRVGNKAITSLTNQGIKINSHLDDLLCPTITVPLKTEAFAHSNEPPPPP